MGNSEEYKHIKVSSGHGDEVVIKAGVRDDDLPNTEVESVIEQRTEVVSANFELDEPDAPSESAELHKPVSSVESNKGYNPTTLEDINDAKMSKVQIVVIVLAVLAVVAFVVWYIAFK